MILGYEFLTRFNWAKQAGSSLDYFRRSEYQIRRLVVCFGVLYRYLIIPSIFFTWNVFHQTEDCKADDRLKIVHLSDVSGADGESRVSAS